VNIVPVWLEGSHQVDENAPEHFFRLGFFLYFLALVREDWVVDIELWNEGTWDSKRCQRT
jgi:hypothetical protein